MLLAPGLSSYGFKYDNWGNPLNTVGTSVVPGASNAEGSWTEIAAAASLTADCYWLMIHIHAGATSAAQKDHLLDIGIDPAGGASYSPIISNVVCGESATLTAGAVGRPFLFPIFVKAGSSVAVRIQGSNATAGTVRVMGKFYGQPSAPETVPVGQFSETIGTITNSGGTSFTPGNGADGTWASLGTTTEALWWWQLGWQISSATITAEFTYIDLAYGDATNKTIIGRQFHIGNTSEIVTDVVTTNLSFLECYCPVPAGAAIYVRGRCNNAPDTGYNAVAIGIGG